MRTPYCLIFLLFVAGSVKLAAQEVVMHLPANPNKSEIKLQQHKTLTKGADLPLSLPFRDDFSYPGPYPNPSLWADNNVYVNTGFAVHPKTVGVATFDILDSLGIIYDHIETGNILFEADYLTSHPIDLSMYGPDDDLVLSFYYQPQGRGGNPGRDERLALQFFIPENDNDSPAKNDDDDDDDDDNGDDEEHDPWISIWDAQGETLSSFSKDTFPYFKRVSIAIEDPDFFREDFRFRFLNKVAVPIGQVNNTGTRSIWNIDYVYLDAGRNLNDSVYHDIAFAAPAQSILRNYTAIPWSQYIADPENMLRERFNVSITNLGGTPYSYTYRYLIKDEGGNILRNYAGGSWTIDPFFETGYLVYQPHSNPIVIPNPLPLSHDTERHFTIVHALRQGADGDSWPQNDTIKYAQSFSNYFAFDYGSPEMIHLVKGDNPSRVLSFESNEADVIEAVQIFFMETMDMQNIDRAFEIVIFSSLDPETELYRSDEWQFVPEDESNAFVTVPLTQEVAVDGTFYVGITQVGNVILGNSLVIGFDLANNVQDRLFIKDGILEDGEWYQSLVGGALMMRPVMKRDAITGIEPITEKPGEITLFPNPVTGNELHVRTKHSQSDWHELQAQIFDIQGRLVYTGHFSSTIILPDLQNGMYLLRISSPGMHINHSARFIISR